MSVKVYTEHKEAPVRTLWSLCAPLRLAEHGNHAVLPRLCLVYLHADLVRATTDKTWACVERRNDRKRDAGHGFRLANDHVNVVAASPVHGQYGRLAMGGIGCWCRR